MCVDYSQVWCNCSQIWAGNRLIIAPNRSFGTFFSDLFAMCVWGAMSDRGGGWILVRVCVCGVEV